MAKMCPMCKAKNEPGMCMHEKMMLGLVVIISLVIIANALDWF